MSPSLSRKPRVPARLISAAALCRRHISIRWPAPLTTMSAYLASRDGPLRLERLAGRALGLDWRELSDGGLPKVVST